MKRILSDRPLTTKEVRERYNLRRGGAAHVSRWRRYKLGPQQFEQMMAAQDGKCALCRTDFGKKRLHVDHAHKSRRVRGLLCARCNVGVGFIEGLNLLRVFVYLGWFEERERGT